MRWGGLEHLKVPQWRTAFEAADVILGVDVATVQEILVFARGALENKLSDLLRAAQRGELVRPHKPEQGETAAVMPVSHDEVAVEIRSRPTPRVTTSAERPASGPGAERALPWPRDRIAVSAAGRTQGWAF